MNFGGVLLAAVAACISACAAVQANRLPRDLAQYEAVREVQRIEEDYLHRFIDNISQMYALLRTVDDGLPRSLAGSEQAEYRACHASAWAAFRVSINVARQRGSESSGPTHAASILMAYLGKRPDELANPGWLIAEYRPFLKEQGVPVGICRHLGGPTGAHHDISDAKPKQWECMQAEEQFSTLFDLVVRQAAAHSTDARMEAVRKLY